MSTPHFSKGSFAIATGPRGYQSWIVDGFNATYCLRVCALLSILVVYALPFVHSVCSTHTKDTHGYIMRIYVCRIIPASCVADAAMIVYRHAVAIVCALYSRLHVTASLLSRAGH